MLSYEAIKELLAFLHVPMPQYHWNNSSRWNMARHMNLQITAQKKEMIQEANFFLLTCDEVTTIDQGIWVSI